MLLLPPAAAALPLLAPGCLPFSFFAGGAVVGDAAAVAAAAAEFAQSAEGRYFFDVFFTIKNPTSNVSRSEICFSLTDREAFRQWAKDYLLPTRGAAQKSTGSTSRRWRAHESSHTQARTGDDGGHARLLAQRRRERH